jgi:hypothetical protein
MEAFPEGTYHGDIPEGCVLCAQGAKMVLFVTGACLGSCYYCPLSTKRKGVWATWANERKVSSVEEVLDEARLMDALGTGITGGDPFLVLDDTITYARALKDAFDDHHIHLYTPGTLVDTMTMGYIEQVIDEIRFHPPGYDVDKIELALRHDIAVGAEIPVIPGMRDEILSFARSLDEIGAHFLNLNELEYSETNASGLRTRGFVFSLDSNAVEGSEQLALDIVDATRDLDLPVHYCSSRFKDGIQFRERLKRRAKNVRKKYEDIDEDGLLVRGEIEAHTEQRRDEMLSTIYELFERDDEMVEVQGTIIRTSWAAVEELREILDMADVQYSIVKEYPTHDRTVVEKEIL